MENPRNEMTHSCYAALLRECGGDKKAMDCLEWQFGLGAAPDALQFIHEHLFPVSTACVNDTFARKSISGATPCLMFAIIAERLDLVL